MLESLRDIGLIYAPRCSVGLDDPWGIEYGRAVTSQDRGRRLLSIDGKYAILLPRCFDRYFYSVIGPVLHPNMSEPMFVFARDGSDVVDADCTSVSVQANNKHLSCLSTPYVRLKFALGIGGCHSVCIAVQ